MSSIPAAPERVATQDPIAATITCSKVLQVIGQDIAGFFPRIFSVTTDGLTFEAQGQCHPNPFEAAKENFLDRIWRRIANKAPGGRTTDFQPPAHFAQTYVAGDITRLDHLYGADREEYSCRADAYSLPERLRAMGTIVDNNNGCFKSLEKQADRLSIEYWDAQGQLQSAKLTTVIFYRNPHPDPCRRHTPTELWEGYDF